MQKGMILSCSGRKSAVFIACLLQQSPSINNQPLQKNLSIKPSIATVPITLMQCGATVQRSDYCVTLLLFGTVVQRSDYYVTVMLYGTVVLLSDYCATLMLYGTVVQSSDFRVTLMLYGTADAEV